MMAATTSAKLMTDGIAMEAHLLTQVFVMKYVEIHGSTITNRLTWNATMVTLSVETVAVPFAW